MNDGQFVNPKTIYMKLTSLFILILIGQACYGQIFINNTDINKLESGTHILVEAGYYSGAKLKVSVDYGQQIEGRNLKQVTVDEGSEKKVFKSPADALNFFLINGWELVDFSITQSDSRTYTYVLKRRKQ